MKKTTAFKQIVLKKRGVVLPVAHDALTALLIERLGFELFGVGGFGVSAASYGYLDMGQIALPEMVDATKRICSVVSIPALVDADTGYGGPKEVKETVRQLEEAGAGAVFIEDQVWPKRCGHIDGKQVVPINDMCSKIMAAVSARRDPDLMIMARTDAIAIEGLNAALKRAKAYVQAGAEIIFIEAPSSLEEVKIIAKELGDIPKMINFIEGGKTPIVPQQEVADMGFNLIAYPLTSLLAAHKAIEQELSVLRQVGISEPHATLTTFATIKEQLRKPITI